MREATNNERLQERFWIIFPFILWLIFFAGFLNGRINLGHDFSPYYFRIKYHIHSMQEGAFPLWNPFAAWGCQDDLDMRSLGEYNPFIYLPLLLGAIGIPFYLGLQLYLALYFWVGMLGFYVLAKRLLKNTLCALVGYNLLLFSSLSQVHF